MAKQKSFQIRWRGVVSGPYDLEQLQAMLGIGEISLMHEAFVDGRWVSVEELIQQRKQPAALAKPTTAAQAPAPRVSVDFIAGGPTSPQPPQRPAPPPPPAEDLFHVAKGGQQQGPYTKSVIRQLVAGGVLSSDDLAWKEGMPEWMALNRLMTDLSMPSLGQPLLNRPTVIHSSPPFGAATRKDDGLQSSLSRGVLSTANRDLMQMARNSMRGRWGGAVGVGVLAYIITSFPSQFLYSLGDSLIAKEQTLALGLLLLAASIVYTLVLCGPIMVGSSAFYVALFRRQAPRVAVLFHGFGIFGKSIAIYLLTSLFILLWSLLLIMPGIVAAYSYSLAYFVAVDNPSISPMSAIKTSKELMAGHKWKLVCLQGRFIGWLLLTVLTCGIALLWIYPYYLTSLAGFYDDIRDRRNFHS